MQRESKENTPILVASHNGTPGFPAAMEILRSGGSALDAVEAATRLVEDNLEDTTVGSAGLPNLLGQVELDALLMDGETLAAGAVAALQRFPNPVSVARRVMETLPHVLLVGEGAARFAREMGFAEAELLTEESRRIWQERLGNTDLYYQKMRDLAATLAEDPEIAAEAYNDGRSVTGTVNFIARDSAGRLAVATSTSGWAWKYPGRVGDTPIVGAGGYADSRYGAAACTGRGEMALRAGTTRSIVLYMKMGLPLWNACREAIKDLYDLVDPYASGMHVVALDAAGTPAAFSNRPGITYLVQRADMDTPELRPRTFVDEQGRAEVRPALVE
ncbi:MAG: N(4)-(beta-N-acetylglucosaminyl)-L-asparaginase [Ardenticatenales bacterium]|nr:N(4)-(beta-N-acetylglucosaminyl)-L-asparaginase [Ardenticatenales bacterium]